MASIREYTNKLKSLNNTRKITKTMKMVSASKLRKAHLAQMNAKAYADDLTAMLSRITTTLADVEHPLLYKEDRAQGKTLIVVFTSDKGLCGAFNANCLKQVEEWIQIHQDDHHEIVLSCCGKKGYQLFHKHFQILKHYEDITNSPRFVDAESVGAELIELFVNKIFDQIYVAYNEFISPLSQKSIMTKILPLDPKELIDKDQPLDAELEYEFEPQSTEMLDYLIRHFVFFKIHFALLENAAGEHGARMSAMDSASKNASELIDKFTLLRNRARQTQITTELTEIVAGMEALQ